MKSKGDVSRRRSSMTSLKISGQTMFKSGNYSEIWECTICLLTFDTKVNCQVILACGHSSICRTCALALFEASPMQRRRRMSADGLEAQRLHTLLQRDSLPPRLPVRHLGRGADETDEPVLLSEENPTTESPVEGATPKPLTESAAPPVTQESVRSLLRELANKRRQMWIDEIIEKGKRGYVNINCPLCRQECNSAYIICGEVSVKQGEIEHKRLKERQKIIKKNKSAAEKKVEADQDAEFQTSMDKLRCRLDCLVLSDEIEHQRLGSLLEPLFMPPVWTDKDNVADLGESREFVLAVEV
eukprot:Platyproteum_vivax@DN409_c0_g1_i1.p2